MTDEPVMPPPPSMSGVSSLAPEVDRSAEFEALSRQTPRDPAAEQEFIAGRLRLVKTHPLLDQAGREAAVAELTRSLGRVAETAKDDPTSVGYGMWYNYDFRRAYVNGTAIWFTLICPTVPGGNVTYLYLTACNRACKGVEALVTYINQEAHFRVFDWARPANEHWQIVIPFAKLGDYLFQSTAHGRTHQCLRITNMTARIPGTGIWRNVVQLFNTKRNGFDKIYEYSYNATEKDQKDGTLDWGPIIETKQAGRYENTNQMGALETQLIAQDGSFNWSAWKKLSDVESQQVNLKPEFRKVFLDPNYAWAAQVPPN